MSMFHNISPGQEKKAGQKKFSTVRLVRVDGQKKKIKFWLFNIRHRLIHDIHVYMIWLRVCLARLYMSLLIHGSREVGAPKHGSAFIHLKQLRLLCSILTSVFSRTCICCGFFGSGAEAAGEAEARAALNSALESNA